MPHLMPHPMPFCPSRRAATRVVAGLAAAMLAACGGGDRNNPNYANDGDTGAAAPATQQTLSPNPSMGDSTTGMSRGTGEGNAAGDTAGAFGIAAGQHGAVPGQPTSGPSADSGLKAQRGAPQTDRPVTGKPLPTTPDARTPRQP
jgi:hypothetical protein